MRTKITDFPSTGTGPAFERYVAGQVVSARLAVVCVSLLAIVSYCSKNPVTTHKESTGKLVFATADTTVGLPGLYTMNLDGSELTPVAVEGDTVVFPGRWGDNYVIGKTSAPSLMEYPLWSPNGEKIVCQLMWAAEGYVIMIMNADGSDKHVLWQVRSAAQRPQWSPEGDKILFIRSGYLGAVLANGIVDASGENDRDFKIAGEAPPIFDGDTAWFHGDYQWGPTGSQIYAIARLNKEPEFGHVGGSWPENEVYSLNVTTGTIEQRITQNNIDENGFRLSPGGQYTAFKRGTYGQANRFYVLSLDNGEVTEIPVDNTVDFFWNWSDDSKRIVFAKDENPDPFINEDLYLYVVDIKKPDELIKLTPFMAREPDLFIPKE